MAKFTFVYQISLVYLFAILSLRMIISPESIDTNSASGCHFAWSCGNLPRRQWSRSHAGSVDDGGLATRDACAIGWNTQVTIKQAFVVGTWIFEHRPHWNSGLNYCPFGGTT